MAEVDRLAQIVDELIVLSRAGERELPGEIASIWTRPSQRALERWSAAAAERGIALEAGDARARAASGARARTPTARSTS